MKNKGVFNISQNSKNVFFEIVNKDPALIFIKIQHISVLYSEGCEYIVMSYLFINL